MRRQSKELFLGIGLMGVVILTTLFTIHLIKIREDLSFLQIDFTDVLIEAKKCLAGSGTVQDPSMGEKGKVFICNRQDLSEMTYPILKDLSRRHLNYKYLSAEECWQQKCDPKKPRINIGRGWRMVMSCDVERGRCEVR